MIETSHWMERPNTCFCLLVVGKQLLGASLPPPGLECGEGQLTHPYTILLIILAF